MLINVAVPVPGLDLLTYSVPDGQPAPETGARVVVPLGTRAVTGIVVETGATATEDREVRAIRQILDRAAFVPAEVVNLARWTAEYYGAGIGETLLGALPPASRGHRADAHKTTRVVTLSAAGKLAAANTATAENTGGRKRSAKQAETLAKLLAAPGGLTSAELGALGISAAVVSRLEKTGFVTTCSRRLDRDPFAASPSVVDPNSSDRVLTPDQHRALERLTALSGAAAFRVALLHGITGSGKTEVYLRLAASVLSSGRTVLMLVPEIALTSAVAELFRARFGAQVAIQHSGLSEGERHDQWQRIRNGSVGVVVGTRSAVFAPLARLGLVIVDEEHDTSYKQEESPRYNGRDVAIVRGEHAQALVLLGSATPSLESAYNAARGRYERIALPGRVASRPLAEVTVVDMREEYAASGADVVLSRPLASAIGEHIARGEQVLVLLNRRGFATALFCRQCANTLECPNCSVTLVVHGQGDSRRARCHYCHYSTRIPRACPACAGPYLEQAGFGTERVEAEVKRVFPAARVARLDRDVVRRKHGAADVLSRLRRGELDVLVGTQMIAKGHDFPAVTLVGVVSADVGLGMPDFRAAERTFQLITQVAGRAGRGEKAGRAIVQTLYPKHYSIELGCRQDYASFYERELAFRKAMRYPPFVAMVNAIVQGRSFSDVMDQAGHLAARLRKLEAGGAFTVLGPAPAALGRLRGQYRAQILLKGTNRRRMREAMQRAVDARPDLARHVIVDIDPVTVQ